MNIHPSDPSDMYPYVGRYTDKYPSWHKTGWIFHLHYLYEDEMN